MNQRHADISVGWCQSQQGYSASPRHLLSHAMLSNVHCMLHAWSLALQPPIQALYFAVQPQGSPPLSSAILVRVTRLVKLARLRRTARVSRRKVRRIGWAPFNLESWVAETGGGILRLRQPGGRAIKAIGSSRAVVVSPGSLFRTPLQEY